MEDEDLYTRITLRIPKDLHLKLSEQAKSTSKSLNAEIIGRLSDSFQSVPSESVEIGINVEAIEKRLEKKNQAFHYEMLLHTLRSQLMNFEYRLKQQNQLVERLQSNIDSADESGDLKAVRNLTAELHSEEKWQRDLVREVASLRAEYDRLEQERSALAASL
ncbi:MAG: toxin-antitoxin system HicB family antitoxin [Comamonas sp.]|uniref:toxin-antitoxin system HicB family antitoxin n=1 Tax=Comamonas sp. TaxID=34028 RepID=UPI003D133BC6